MRKAQLPIGTFINTATTTAGSLLGLWLQHLFPPEIIAIIFQAMSWGLERYRNR